MSKKDLPTDSTDSTDTSVRAEFDALAAEIGGGDGEYVEEAESEMYDRYYCASLSGVLGFYGVNRTKPAVLDDLAHRMALQSMATEGMRRGQAVGMMVGRSTRRGAFSTTEGTESASGETPAGTEEEV